MRIKVAKCLVAWVRRPTVPGHGGRGAAGRRVAGFTDGQRRYSPVCRQAGGAQPCVAGGGARSGRNRYGCSGSVPVSSQQVADCGSCVNSLWSIQWRCRSRARPSAPFAEDGFSVEKWMGCNKATPVHMVVPRGFKTPPSGGYANLECSDTVA